MSWGVCKCILITISRKLLDPNISLYGHIKFKEYEVILCSYVHDMMEIQISPFCNNDNALIHTAKQIQEWFHEHQIKVIQSHCLPILNSIVYCSRAQNVEIIIVFILQRQYKRYMLEMNMNTVAQRTAMTKQCGSQSYPTCHPSIEVRTMRRWLMIWCHGLLPFAWCFFFFFCLIE